MMPPGRLSGLCGAFAGLAALLVAAMALPAAAQDWPTKPVRLVSPFAAGGGSDIAARILAENLSKQFGQQFYVENRGGAGGLIGTAMVSKAPADGYTFVVSSISTHVLAPITSGKAEYDPIRDFTHVAFLGGPPTVIVTHPSMGVTSFGALLEKLRRNTAPEPYSTAGPGTLGNLLMEYLAEKHVPLSHISYKGAGQAISDLVAGHIKLAALTSTAARAQITGQLVTPIAFSSAARFAEFPDVPTLKELGYPGLVATAWFGIAGPAGVPTQIVTRLNEAIGKALDTPEVRRRLIEEGIEIGRMSPAELTSYVKAEEVKWGPLAKRIASTSAPQ